MLPPVHDEEEDTCVSYEEEDARDAGMNPRPLCLSNCEDAREVN